MELHSDDAAARGLRRYVRLVGDTLGLRAGSCFDLEQPISAYLALEQRLPQSPTRDAALLWDELQGWAMATESPRTDDLLIQAYLGTEVLPAPRVVERFAARLLRGEPAGQADPPDLRSPEIQDDLLERLAAYARHTVGEVVGPEPGATITPIRAAQADDRPSPVTSDLLEIRIERIGPRICLHIRGELDLLTAPRLQESVDDAVARHPELLILDLSEVQFLGSIGISVLLSAHDHLSTLVRVVADGAAVRRPLEALGLTTVLAIYPTVDAARTDPLPGARDPATGRSQPAG